MNKMNENETIALFLTKFYDLCATTDSFNYTLSEFYDEFPAEMHDFLIKNINEIKKGMKNA